MLFRSGVEQEYDSTIEKINQLKQQKEIQKENLIKMKGFATCEACGFTNNDEATFCSKCGNKL